MSHRLLLQPSSWHASHPVQPCIGAACARLLLLLLVQKLGFEVLRLVQKLGLKMALQLLLCMQTITSTGTVRHLRSVLTSAAAHIHCVMAVP